MLLVVLIAFQRFFNLTDEAKSLQYWSGMEALAKLPNTYVKISDLPSIGKQWDQNPVVIDTVHRVVALFGPDRRFFTSDFPVGKKNGWEVDTLYTAFLKLSAPYRDYLHNCSHSTSKGIATLKM